MGTSNREENEVKKECEPTVNICGSVPLGTSGSLGRKWFSKCGPRTNNIDITCEHVRSTSSHALLWTSKVEYLGTEPIKLFKQMIQVFLMHIKILEPLIYYTQEIASTDSKKLDIFFTNSCVFEPLKMKEKGTWEMDGYTVILNWYGLLRYIILCFEVLSTIIFKFGLQGNVSKALWENFKLVLF